MSVIFNFRFFDPFTRTSRATSHSISSLHTLHLESYKTLISSENSLFSLTSSMFIVLVVLLFLGVSHVFVVDTFAPVVDEEKGEVDDDDDDDNKEEME